jgi:hypothetical protein
MISEKLLALSNKLNLIPHLNLTKYLDEVPLELLLKDLFKFETNDFYPYITGNSDPRIAKHMANNWHAFCMIDTCKSGKHNIDYITTTNNFNKLEFHQDEVGNFIYKPTDIGELVPNTIDYLYSFIESPEKTRMSKIMPNGGNATWHSHKLLAEKGDSRFNIGDRERLEANIITPVIHIPLITNKDSWMGVCEDHPGVNPNTNKIWKHYNPGEVWLFNSYYFHNAVNNGKNSRTHIMMYAPIDDLKLMPILEKAVAEYSGPLLSGKTVSYN